MLTDFLFYSFSLVLIYEDWRYQKLSLWIMVIFGLLGLFVKGEWQSCLILGILSICFYRGGLCAWGDVILLTTCGTWLAFVSLPLFFILTGLGLLLLRWAQQHPHIPLAPAAVVSLWLIRWIN